MVEGSISTAVVLLSSESGCEWWLEEFEGPAGECGTMVVAFEVDLEL